MNEIVKKLLESMGSWIRPHNSAYYIRENGRCAGTSNSKNIIIEPLTEKSGLRIHIKASTDGEQVYIPVCVTNEGMNDEVCNDFYIEAGAKVIITAGCGVHTDSDGAVRHSGKHRFFVGKDACVTYHEKHIGTGNGKGKRTVDPVTEIYLEPYAFLQMDTIQIGGVDNTTRHTTAQLDCHSQLLIHESLLTEHRQIAKTEFLVSMDGEDSSVDLVSRSVAKDHSYQDYHSCIKGNCKCTGHSECDAILAGNGMVNASPELFAGSLEAVLIHEAAIGKIAGEQITKLQTLGLTAEQAEKTIIQGFLTASY